MLRVVPEVQGTIGRDQLPWEVLEIYQVNIRAIQLIEDLILIQRIFLDMLLINIGNIALDLLDFVHILFICIHLNILLLVLFLHLFVPFHTFERSKSLFGFHFRLIKNMTRIIKWGSLALLRG